MSQTSDGVMTDAVRNANASTQFGASPVLWVSDLMFAAWTAIGIVKIQNKLNEFSIKISRLCFEMIQCAWCGVLLALHVFKIVGLKTVCCLHAA